MGHSDKSVLWQLIFSKLVFDELILLLTYSQFFLLREFKVRSFPCTRSLRAARAIRDLPK